MKTTLDDIEAALLQQIQPSFPQEGIDSVAVVEDSDRHPKASIKGDICIFVTEQEVARGPIIGRYTIETEDMREPLFALWQAQNGAVLNRYTRSTAIAFDLSGARVDQLWTPVITVQVTDADTYETIISGTFVQILVTKDHVL
ncbi:MAG: hypothetical protein ACJ788_27665 [Ktedonobacteraceae bacterium]